MRKEITIACEDGPLVIDADVFGNWAAHGIVMRGDHTNTPSSINFAVTHVPTGLTINNVTGWLSREHAARLAEFLNIVAPVASQDEAVRIKPVIKDAVSYVAQLSKLGAPQPREGGE